MPLRFFNVKARHARALVLLVCSTLQIAFAQMAGPVSISVSPSATSKEMLAAKEARRYVYLRTGILLEIKPQDWSSIPANENAFVIASMDSETVKQFLSAHSLAAPQLGKEDFYLKTVGDDHRKAILVTGTDGTATLRAAYKLMENFGIRYSPDGDIIAEGLIPFDLPVIDKIFRPNFEVRGMLPYHSWNPEGPEYWNADYYKAFMKQNFKMGNNVLGLVHDYMVSDTRAWVWHPTKADNKETRGYEMTVNPPAAGARQVFPDSIFASSRRLEARKIADLAERKAFMRRANLDFLKDIFGYAAKIDLGTIYGSEHSGDLDYYLQFFEDLKTFKPDHYWLMTKEYWTWKSGYVTDQDFIWILEGITHAVNAKARTGAGFQIGTIGWKLGPPLTPDAQTVISEHLPADAFVSAQTPNVGQDPVQPEWALITKQKDKWIIPWLQDDFSVANQQLWVDRTIKQAADGKRYGCNGLIGVHWTTKEITPQSMVLAQLGWDGAITKDGFWDDFCLINFGPEVAEATAAIFKRQDGNMARVTNWIDNWPGTLASGIHDFSYVAEFEALRPKVTGASNLERFDYYLNLFRYNQALGALANDKDNPKLYREVMNVLLPATYTPGEIGHIITLARQGQLGRNVGGEYEGKPHLVVLTPRGNLFDKEDFNLDVFFVESETPKKVEMFLKTLGSERFNVIEATRQTNPHHFKLHIPAGALRGRDFEYFIRGTSKGGKEHFAPRSAPGRNFTVVYTTEDSGGRSSSWSSEKNSNPAVGLGREAPGDRQSSFALTVRTN